MHTHTHTHTHTQNRITYALIHYNYMIPHRQILYDLSKPYLNEDQNTQTSNLADTLCYFHTRSE